MAQNRNKLIQLVIGNLHNAVVHKILEQAIEDENIRKYYDKELMNSFNKAREYREQINPKESVLPGKDIERIRNQIIQKAKNELLQRIKKGYIGINIENVETFTDEMLIKLKIE